MQIYAETGRLTLRSLEKTDLPRIVELIGDWEVARWLVSVPYPYSLTNAEEFYARMNAVLQNGKLEFFLLEHKSDAVPIGAIGLHPSREPEPQPGEIVAGYWLGKTYWGRGLMSEALRSVIGMSFGRADTRIMTATTDPVNEASQNVLRKAGFACLGISPSRDKAALRGSAEVTRWELTRENYEKGRAQL